MSLYQKLLSERKTLNGTPFNNTTVFKKAKIAEKPTHNTIRVKAILLRFKKTNSGNYKHIFLKTNENVELKNVPKVFTVLHTQIIENIFLGEFATIKIGVSDVLVGKKKSKKDSNAQFIFSDIEREQQSKNHINLSIFNCDPCAFHFSKNSDTFRKNDILFPITSYYLDDMQNTEDNKNGFLTERPKFTTVKDTYGFKREYTLEFAQWENSNEPLIDHLWFETVISFPLLVLQQCFRVNNEIHWRDDEYANKWLLNTEYVINTYVTENSYRYITSKKHTPGKIYTVVRYIYINLLEAIKKNRF
jgi:hypothetical protein